MKDLKPIQLSDNIVWISVNASLVFSEGQGILIDTSFSTENLKLILKTLKQLHITNLIILNTHRHYHHAANNKLLLETFPNTKIYAPKWQYNCEKNKDKLKLILENTQTLILDNADIRVQVLHSGGHTVGHTMYLVRDNKKILFTGDILHTISQLYSSIGPIPHIERPSINLFNQYLEAIEVIKKVRPHIVCGHTCVGTCGELTWSIIRKTERVIRRINELIEEHWRNYLSEQEIARRVFIDICNEMMYNPNLRFAEKLESGKTVYEQYDLPLLLAMIKKHKQSVGS